MPALRSGVKTAVLEFVPASGSVPLPRELKNSWNDPVHTENEGEMSRTENPMPKLPSCTEAPRSMARPKPALITLGLIEDRGLEIAAA